MQLRLLARSRKARPARLRLCHARLASHPNPGGPDTPPRRRRRRLLLLLLLLLLPRRAWDRMLSIIERTNAKRTPRNYYQLDKRGRVVPALDSDGGDTDYDRWALWCRRAMLRRAMPGRSQSKAGAACMIAGMQAGCMPAARAARPALSC